MQLLPGIGTWAARQRLFGRPADLGSLPRSPSASPATPAEGGTPEGKAGGGGNAPVVLAAAAGGAGGAGSPPAAPPQLRRVSSSVKSEQAREAAWRWRFSRKWEAEQKKYYEDPPGAGSLLSNDELDAIQYTQVGAARCALCSLLQRRQELCMRVGVAAAGSGWVGCSACAAARGRL